MTSDNQNPINSPQQNIETGISHFKPSQRCSFFSFYSIVLIFSLYRIKQVAIFPNVLTPVFSFPILFFFYCFLFGHSFFTNSFLFCFFPKYFFCDFCFTNSLLKGTVSRDFQNYFFNLKKLHLSPTWTGKKVFFKHFVCVVIDNMDTVLARRWLCGPARTVYYFTM